MLEVIRPVRYGILVGLLGIVFGMSWAFWLVLGHDGIHKSLEARAVVSNHDNMEDTHGGVSFPANAYAHEHAVEAESGHAHADGVHHDEGVVSSSHNGMDASSEITGTHNHTPIMELAHRRLTRGHLHAMGLGLFTIVISMVIAFTTAPAWIKTVAPVLAGVGGIIYPLAWIVIGYRTPALGVDAAEASVTHIAGPGILLILTGILVASGFLLKDIFLKKAAVKIIEEA